MLFSKIRFYVGITIASVFSISFIHCRDEWQGVGDENWSFVVVGDVRQGYGVYGKLVTYMSRIKPTPDLTVCCGDIMLRAGNEVEWRNFWKHSEPLTEQMPFFIVRGGHEGNDPAAEQVLREQMNLPGSNFYYSYQNLDAYFIFLDTEIRGEEGSIVNGQLAWLRHQLDTTAAAPEVDHVFIFLHQPLFPQGKYKGSNLKNADELHALFLQYPKIKAVIAAHEHSFHAYRHDGLLYLTTGGGGAPLYHGYGGDYYHFVKISFYISENRINVKTIGIFDETIEDFDI
jgi:hypothetical protein